MTFENLDTGEPTNDQEVDLIAERHDEMIVGFEIKVGREVDQKGSNPVAHTSR